MTVSLTDPSLVLLIGPSGSGKSTFARKHFRATEVLSSDYCRALICDDEKDQTATDDAFELVHFILAKRLARHKTTVIDATNVKPASRASLLALAGRWSVPAVAILFQLPEDVCQQRNLQRVKRQVPQDVIASQIAALAESGEQMGSEGFAAIYSLANEAETEAVIFLRA